MACSLPGVGRYAANATRVVAFGKRAPVVDGVSARVYRRYLGLPSELPATSDQSLWDEVDEATPRRESRSGTGRSWTSPLKSAFQPIHAAAMPSRGAMCLRLVA